jgi:hypothetical protein
MDQSSESDLCNAEGGTNCLKGFIFFKVSEPSLRKMFTVPL